jgi:hypothetical protein
VVRSAFTFGIPTIWREPKNQLEDCYFCSFNVKAINRKNRHKWGYPSTTYVCKASHTTFRWCSSSVDSFHCWENFTNFSRWWLFRNKIRKWFWIWLFTINTPTIFTKRARWSRKRLEPSKQAYEFGLFITQKLELIKKKTRGIFGNSRQKLHGNSKKIWDNRYFVNKCNEWSGAQGYCSQMSPDFAWSHLTDV